MPHCNAFVLGKRFRFDELHAAIRESHRAALLRDVLHIELGDGQVFVFPYGVLIFWGCDYDSEKRLLDLLKPFAQEPLASTISDAFTFDPQSSEAKVRADHIPLVNDEPLTLLAWSHAIAQSVKLTELEEYAERTIEETSFIPRTLAIEGTISLNRKAIAKMRGRLFLVESEIVLHHALLDTPEFFWEYPELEEFYKTMANYLELDPRLGVLNKKLSVIHQIFDMLADEQKHKHSALLEWIIIWLIVFEIVFFLLHDLFGII